MFSRLYQIQTEALEEIKNNFKDSEKKFRIFEAKSPHWEKEGPWYYWTISLEKDPKRPKAPAQMVKNDLPEMWRSVILPSDLWRGIQRFAGEFKKIDYDDKCWEWVINSSHSGN